MSRTKILLAAFGALGAIGLAACEDEEAVSIDTGDGEVSIEEDGDIDVDE